MGTKKWSEIKTLSKANVADRAEARAELDEEIRSYCAPELRSRPPTSQQISELRSIEARRLIDLPTPPSSA